MTSCTARLFNVLDAELSKALAFSFTISENLTRPGSTSVRAKDRFRFTVWATNHASIDLKWLRGMIEPTAVARFVPLPFSLARLRPQERALLGTVEAEIVPTRGTGFIELKLIGSVRATTSPDLSRFRIRKSQPLTYVRSA